MRTFRVPTPGLALLGLCAAGVVTMAGVAPAIAREPAPRIQVLSNRADLVSGGYAVVRVTLPRGVEASRLQLTAGRRASAALEQRG